MHVKELHEFIKANTKGKLNFDARNEEGKLLPVRLEVPIILKVAASALLAGELREKEVELDGTPPLTCGNAVTRSRSQKKH